MIIRVLIVLMALVVSAAGQDLTRQVRDMGAERQRRMAAAQRCSTNADASVTWADIRDELQSATSNLDVVVTAGIADATAKKAVVDIKKATRDTIQAMNKLVKKMKETERIEREARRR